MNQKNRTSFALAGSTVIAILFGSLSECAVEGQSESAMEQNASLADAKLQEQMTPLMTEFGSASAKFSDPIEAAGAKYPNVFSRFEVEMENEKVVIGYDQSADESERDLFFAEVEHIMAPLPFELEFSPKSYNRHEVEAVSDELTTDSERWAPRFGNSGYAAAPDIEGDGIVRVSTERKPDSKWSNFEYNGVTVVVEQVDGPVVTF